MTLKSVLRALAPSAFSVISLLNPPMALGAGAIPEGLSEPLVVFVMQMTPEGEMIARSLIGREVHSREDAIEALWRLRERAPLRIRTEFESRLRQIDTQIKSRVNGERINLDAEVLTRVLVQRGFKTGGSHLTTLEFLPMEPAPAVLGYAAAKESFLDGVLSPNRYRTWDRASVNEAGRAGKSLARARVALMDLSGLRLEGINLAEIEGQYVDLSGASLARSNFRGANLPWAGFNAADLYRADLRQAHLSWSLMEHANLVEARLEGTMASGARLYRANLSRVRAKDSAWFAADLSRAKLIDADLRGADLRTADLRGADLTGARLEDANLEGAFYSPETVLPFSSTEAQTRGMLLSDERIHGE